MKKYLYMKKNDYEKTKIDLINKDIPKIACYNDLIHKIDGLYYLEKVLKIKRFDINSIDENINIEKTKKILLKNIDKLYVFNDITLGKKTKEKRITAKINKILYYDQLQKFMTDCYNTFGKIIKYNIIKNNKRSTYNNFNNNFNNDFI